jgi:mediator of RNA polymerase II transcription subunit 5
MSQVSTAQAMVHFADANDLLQNFRLSSDVRQVLETFVLSLSLLIGDDAKAAREAQMMHTIQLELGKGDMFGSSSNTDIVTMSLVLHYLASNASCCVIYLSYFHFQVSYRASEFGSGSGTDSVALLVGMFSWTSWTPAVFYSQLLLSAFTCLSQCFAASAVIWRSFIIGRVRQPDTFCER